MTPAPKRRRTFTLRTLFTLVAIASCLASSPGKILGAEPSAGPSPSAVKPGTAGAKPPNILVICADDHAAYVAGAYGNRQVRTPNIDRLAAGGILFERAYCNSPVCTASRQSFLTGRYPRTVGVTRLETPLPDSEVTMAETLRRAEFDTAAIGKMHFNSNLKHGFDLRIDQSEHRAWLAAQPPAAQPTATLPSGVEVQPPWRPFQDPARVWLNSACRPVGAFDAQMDGSYFAAQAAEYLAKRRDKPFFLMVSFYEPHSPYRFPVEFRDRHRAEEFSAPVPGPEDAARVPQVFRDLTDNEKQGIAAAYYTSVEYLDKNVGAVLDALDRSGRAADTVVVYLSDHGYLLGQHGRFEKHCSFEEAVRAPLVIRFPGRIAPGRRTRALVELVDLVPTIYNLCGFQTTAPLQGRSLMPLLRAQTTKHRDHVIVEYAPNDEVMIRDEYWKLIYERGAQRRTDGYDFAGPLVPNVFRLYDLHSDPQELHNVVASPRNAETVKRLTDLLVEHLVKTAREPAAVPQTSDPLTLLDYCVQSRDVPPPSKRD
jgi:choline-sulfatase